MDNGHDPATIGICRLCGDRRRLTFEHIPPRRAFNNHGVALHTIDSIAKRFRTRRKFRKGLGRTSLCETCNGRTAKDYGDGYAQWAVQAFEICDKAAQAPTIHVPFTIQPLAVLKQVIVMMLAMSAPHSIRLPHYRDLRRFILNPRAIGLPPPFRVFTYLSNGGELRFTDNAAVMDILRTGASAFIFAEIAHPPVGFCITNDDPQTLNLVAKCGLADISHFGRRPYRAIETVWLRLPCLEPGGPCPLDYLSQR